MRASSVSLLLCLIHVNCTAQPGSKAPETPRHVKETSAPELDGSKVFASKACNVCHSVDGKPGVGPTMKGLYNSKVEIEGGKPIKADEAYLRESILDPNAKITKGFPAVMPKPSLNAAEVDALVNFIKSLS